MIDKRFWSGAIIGVTIVVAGASALPAFLLRPASPDPAAVSAAPAAIPKKIQPGAALVEAKPAAAQPEAPSVALPLPPPQPVAATQPPAEVPAPQPVAAPSPEPAPVVREAAPAAFPPVQPVGVATASGPDAAPAARAPVANAKEKPARKERAAERTPKRRQVVRPALYPIREFFAWRR